MYMGQTLHNSCQLLPYYYWELTTKDDAKDGKPPITHTIYALLRKQLSYVPSVL